MELILLKSLSNKRKQQVEESYQNVGIRPDAIAEAVLYALTHPSNVNVSEIMVRSTLEP